MVPPVREDLYEKVVTTLNPRGEAGLEPGETVVTDMPTSWDAIKPGHLVLFHEGLADGWWEAIVVSRSGDKITLRCRDFPGYSKFTMRVTDIALLGLEGIDRDFAEASATEAPCDVRFTPESGHVRCTQGCRLWANSGHLALWRALLPAYAQRD
jgi:hypothetical protein